MARPRVHTLRSRLLGRASAFGRSLCQALPGRLPSRPRACRRQPRTEHVSLAVGLGGTPGAEGQPPTLFPDGWMEQPPQESPGASRIKTHGGGASTCNKLLLLSWAAAPGSRTGVHPVCTCLGLVSWAVRGGPGSRGESCSLGSCCEPCLSKASEVRPCAHFQGVGETPGHRAGPGSCSIAFPQALLDPRAGRSGPLWGPAALCVSCRQTPGSS